MTCLPLNKISVCGASGFVDAFAPLAFEARGAGTGDEPTSLGENLMRGGRSGCSQWIAQVHADGSYDDRRDENDGV